MNLSKTAQYAIRVICYMSRDSKQIYPASVLVKKLKISDKYLKRILTTLAKQKIVRSIQGRYGGFVLNKKPEEIYLSDIVSAVENIDIYYGCILGFKECSDENPCPLHEKWVPIRDAFFSFLRNNSIADILKNPNIAKF
jgi:Rrf2 family iron-sulfur cluster assembly transcriptional regulator